LRLLALEGAIVTIDAMGCQTAIAAQVVERRADYVLALKDHHPLRHERVRKTFADADAAVGTTLPLGDLVAHTTTDKDHGRIDRVLDVAFHEDDSRVRVGHGPENFAILRHIALNVLRQERSSRGSVATKRFRAALNDTYLHSILTGLSA